MSRADVTLDDLFLYEVLGEKAYARMKAKERKTKEKTERKQKRKDIAP